MGEPSDSKIKIAIGELLRDADPISKLILGAYSHRAQHNVNVKVLSGSKFKTEQLESCAKFVGLKTRDEDNSAIYTNKPTLADRIITKIESFFPSMCHECGEEYQVKLNDPPTNQRLHCFLCLQPSHSCEPVQASIQMLQDLPSKLAGNVWICSGCFEKNNPLLSNNQRKRAASVSVENRTPSSSPALGQPSQTSSRQPTEEPPQNTPPPPPGEPRQEVQQQDSISDIPDERTNCQRYLNNQCPHGINGNKVINGESCKDYHPRRCYRYCKFGTKRRIGCQNGDSCSKLHPKLCKYSVRSSACYNENCKFVHLKGTKRNRDQDGHPENQPQSQYRDVRDIQPQQGIANRRMPTTPAHRPVQRTRFNSTTSERIPEVPSQGFNNTSSEVSFLVRMIQDMKSDFQKDISQLRDTIQHQTIHWNPPAFPTAPPHPQCPAQVINPQELQTPYLPPQQGHTIPLWSQNIPQFFS